MYRRVHAAVWCKASCDAAGDAAVTATVDVMWQGEGLPCLLLQSRSIIHLTCIVCVLPIDNIELTGPYGNVACSALGCAAVCRGRQRYRADKVGIVSLVLSHVSVRAIWLPWMQPTMLSDLVGSDLSKTSSVAGRQRCDGEHSCHGEQIVISGAWLWSSNVLSNKFSKTAPLVAVKCTDSTWFTTAGPKAVTLPAHMCSNAPANICRSAQALACV